MLGVAISAMVLTGTLIVGDSVEYSLERTAELRLGNIGYAFYGSDRYFRADLADEVGEDLGAAVSAIMQLDGFGSSRGGELKLNNIHVQGIDDDFLDMIPWKSIKDIPGKNEAFISENMANRLQLKIDDSFLLRVEKVSLIPKNAPFISDSEDQVSMRLTVKRILEQEELGRFNLKTSQTAPFNVFVSLDYLNDRMETSGKANRLLIADDPRIDADQATLVIKNRWNLEDSGLKIEKANEDQEWSIESDRVFIDSVVIEAIKQLDNNPALILTYLANAIETEERSTPYSFVSAGPFGKDYDKVTNEIIVNSWLAEDLNLHKGDSLMMTYFIIGPLRKMEERNQWFQVKEIVAMNGIYSDRKLMPTLPGLSDAGSCRNWETGIPIDLEKIRDKDEAYWNIWKGTPKAFISYPMGKSLWENRFGSCTAIRLSASAFEREEIEAGLLNSLHPESFGFSLNSVKSDGLKAAHGGVDFAQLFMGMSFFLLLAGLTLLALLFNIHLERRISQIGTLMAIGYPDPLVKRIILYESFIVAIFGVLLGSLLAIAYNKLIFLALNTVWSEIVRTSVLLENVKATSLLMGMAISFILVFIAIFFNLNRKLKIKPVKLQRGADSTRFIFSSRYINGIAWVIGIVSFILLFRELILSTSLNTGIFFLAGGLMLLAMILFVVGYFYSDRKKETKQLTFRTLAFRNLQRNRSRSIRIVVLFALGTFVIVSTGLNRKDLYSDATSKGSGTGGYLYFGETTLPILHDLNLADTRIEYGFESQMQFIQMRKNEGDDASCLNLNLISNPRLLGIPAADLKGRFSFITTSEEFNPSEDWLSLKQKLPGGLVPAIADQTVIQWGLGMKVGDTLIYKNEFGAEMHVKLIAGLANSIFQGNILIDESQFLKHFPTSSGINVFLVDAETQDRASLESEIGRSFRNAGLELQYTADRLAEFNSVENTYLSIFLLLGGLGMILGTVGLGLSLIRNIQDRQQELGILRAIGYKRNKVLVLLTREHVILLGIGTLIGAFTAFLATTPSIFSAYIEASWQTALVIVALIFVNGLAWIYFIGKSSLKKRLVAALRSE
jgi:ABC-type lipoprotein release transport system permease subunit